MKLSIITTASQFDTLTSYFMSKDRAVDTANYFSWVLSSVSRYIESGDVQFLNNCVTASKLVGQVRITRELLDCGAAHKFGKGGYVGKANKKTLTDVRDNADKVYTKVQELITQHFQQKAEKKAEVKTVDQLAEDFAKLIKRRQIQLLEAGLTQEQVMNIIVDAMVVTEPEF